MYFPWGKCQTTALNWWRFIILFCKTCSWTWILVGVHKTKETYFLLSFCIFQKTWWCHLGYIVKVCLTYKSFLFHVKHTRTTNKSNKVRLITHYISQSPCFNKLLHQYKHLLLWPEKNLLNKNTYNLPSLEIHNILYKITSLAQGGTMCTTLAQCGIKSATLFNKLCVTSKNCTQWSYHLPWP